MWALWAITAALLWQVFDGGMSAFLAIFIFAAVVSIAESVRERR